MEDRERKDWEAVLSRWKTENEEGLGGCHDGRQRGRPGEAVTMEDRKEGLGGSAVTMEVRERKAWEGCHDGRQREEGLGRVEEVEGGKSRLQQSSETNYPVNCLPRPVPTPQTPTSASNSPGTTVHRVLHSLLRLL